MEIVYNSSSSLCRFIMRYLVTNLLECVKQGKFGIFRVGYRYPVSNHIQIYFILPTHGSNFINRSRDRSRTSCRALTKFERRTFYTKKWPGVRAGNDGIHMPFLVPI